MRSQRSHCLQHRCLHPGRLALSQLPRQGVSLVSPHTLGPQLGPFSSSSPGQVSYISPSKSLVLSLSTHCSPGCPLCFAAALPDPCPVPQVRLPLPNLLAAPTGALCHSMRHRELCLHGHSSTMREATEQPPGRAAVPSPCLHGTGCRKQRSCSTGLRHSSGSTAGSQEQEAHLTFGMVIHHMLIWAPCDPPHL